MTDAPLAILRTGLVTSVGLSAPAASAAMRAKISNPSETHFIDSAGELIMAHQVPLQHPWRGLAKLAKMAAMAIDECLAHVPRDEWSSIPLLLCVAELDGPGRLDGLDDRLFLDIQRELGEVRFAPESAVVAHGRVGVAVALRSARTLIHERQYPRVLIAATDSLLTWGTLSRYEREGRLLTGPNSNGFIPGEGAGALLVGNPTRGAQLLCTGLGFAVEKAHIDSGQPLRAEGLTIAIKTALADAGVEMHDVDYRITDLSGEQYYFKEAALALSRLLRVRREETELWHPAECCGQTGAAAGAICLALADTAFAAGFAPGVRGLVHLSNDGGNRAAIALQPRGR